ncbi:hypothetical protein ACHAWF_003805 [Thalassiosira exigua]
MVRLLLPPAPWDINEYLPGIYVGDNIFCGLGEMKAPPDLRLPPAPSPRP